MGVMDESKRAVRRISMWDWGLVKISCMIFGILIAYLYPPIRYWLDWYWWIVLAFLICVPVFMHYSKPKLSRKEAAQINNGGVLGYEWRRAQKNLWIWDWGLVKWASMLFGLAIVSYYPKLIDTIEWYWFVIAFVACMVLPYYAIYFDKPAKAKKPGSIRWKNKKKKKPKKKVKKNAKRISRKRK